jgi:hypothetical protein
MKSDEEIIMGFAEISRKNPTCYIFLIDQSESMAEKIAIDPDKTKAEKLKDYLNYALMELAISCCREDGIRDFLYVSVIGYGKNVGPAFAGPLANKDIIPIREIANNPAKLIDRPKDDGAGGLVNVRFPEWFFPVAEGPKPMCEALNKAKSILEGWLSEHPHCYPPIVVNITDGAATDGNPLIPAVELKNLKSSAGNVLLYNIHLSSRFATPITFPTSETKLPEREAHVLYTMSSFLPDDQVTYSNWSQKLNIEKNSRCFVYNADLDSIFSALSVLSKERAKTLYGYQEGILPSP